MDRSRRRGCGLPKHIWSQFNPSASNILVAEQSSGALIDGSKWSDGLNKWFDCWRTGVCMQLIWPSELSPGAVGSLAGVLIVRRGATPETLVILPGDAGQIDFLTNFSIFL